MHIQQPAPEDLWWEVARACSYATFFHTPLWHKLAVDAYPAYRDASIAIECEDGVRAVLPLLDEAPLHGLGRGYVSTFAACYGDLIATGPVDEATRTEILRRVRGLRVLRAKIIGNPLAPSRESPPGFQARPDVTHMIRLDEPLDIMTSRFSSNHRRSIARARREGVSVREATTEREYRTYYEAYLDSLRRWGERATSRYPWKLFERGFAMARQHPDHIKLWLARREGEILAGAWIFYWRDHAAYWHGAMFERAMPFRPSHLLHAEIMRDAIERGFRWYDFNPSGGHEGVVRFKRGFGADAFPLQRWTYEGLSARFVHEINDRLGFTPFFRRRKV